jgi:hypothetical protein
VPARRPARSRRKSPPTCAAEIDHGRLRRGLHGHVQRHHPRRTALPTGVYKERLSQSALYYGATQVSDAEARAVYQWLPTKGMKFHLGTGRGDRAHRGAGPLAVQDLHRRRAHRRRVRLRDHRHPIPAGPQGSPARQRSRRGHLNNTDRPPVKNADGEVIRAGEPLRTSTKSTNAPASTASSPTASPGARPARREHAARPALG